jgi:hypothetical protein
MHGCRAVSDASHGVSGQRTRRQPLAAIEQDLREARHCGDGLKLSQCRQHAIA